MDEVPWSEPVSFRADEDETVTVAGPREALDWLLNRWPVDTGEAYEQAKRRCYRTMEGVPPRDQSRQAFINAILEADFPIDRKA